MADRQSMCAVARLRLQSSTVLVFAMLLSDQRRQKSRQLRTDVGGSCLDQSDHRYIHWTKSCRSLLTAPITSVLLESDHPLHPAHP